MVVFGFSKEDMLFQRSSSFWILGAWEEGGRVLRGFVDFLEIARFGIFALYYIGGFLGGLEWEMRDRMD